MSIINRYILRELLKFFVFILGGVIVLYLVVDFFEKLDNFIEAGVAGTKIVKFFLLNIPFITAQVTPLALLLAILVVLGLMNKNNEIIALRSGGVSIFALLKPVVGLGVAISIALFFFSDLVVPLTMDKANKIWMVDVRKKELVTTRHQNIWIRGNRQITKIAMYDPEKQTIHGVSIYGFNDEFDLVRRVDAAKGVYSDNQWVLFDIIEQHRSLASDELAYREYEGTSETLGFSPEDFRRVIKSPSEMRFMELLEYTKNLSSQGYNVVSHRVDLHAKISFPLVCVVLSAVGLGLATRTSAKESLPIKISYGLGIAFCYWVAHSFFVSLGYGEMVPPLVAAWITNLLFAGIGVAVFLWSD
jgi:lipopolysaccharide export system permease protein